MNNGHQLVACAAGWAMIASANPYDTIANRNVFNLVPPKAATSQSGEIFKPPPEYKLTGIAGFGPNKWALLSKADPGKPPQNFMLREGQTEGPLEIVHVDEMANVVRIRNDGVLVDLTFSTNAVAKVDLVTQRFVDNHTRAHELHQKREAERVARERAEVERLDAERTALEQATSTFNPEQQ